MKRRGDVVGGYRLVTDPTNDGGGNCMWAFAEKDGRGYFVKRFLEPKRPREDAPGSAESTKLRLEECEAFEERHRSIMRRLRPDISGGGNLVLAVDFFHEGSTYYKVTERIETAGLDHPERLSGRDRAVLLKTLVRSVERLHEIGVVHGDLKPGNVLVRKKPGGLFHIAKLIDFDDSYVSGKPPDRELIGGDVVFGAPEWRRYMQGDEEVRPEDLTTAADMFSLGLIIHHYLTGEPPGFERRFPFAADAVIAGAPLRVDERLGPVMAETVLKLTSRAPGGRPRIAELLGVLTEEHCTLTTRETGPGPGSSKGGSGPPDDERGSPERGSGSGEGEPDSSEGGSGFRESRVRISSKDRAPGTSAPSPRPVGDGKPASRVRVNLTDRHR